MKKLILIFLLLSVSSTITLSNERLNKVSFNPIQLFGFNILNAEYERGFSDGKLGVSFYMGRSGMFGAESAGYQIFVSHQKVGIKYYTRNIQRNSLWLGGQLSAASGYVYGIEGNNSDDEALVNGTLGVIGKIGYQLVLGSFLIDLHAGAGYALTNNLYGESYYSGGIGESNLLLDFGINTGIVF